MNKSSLDVLTELLSVVDEKTKEFKEVATEERVRFKSSACGCLQKARSYILEAIDNVEISCYGPEEWDKRNFRLDYSSPGQEKPDTDEYE